MIFIPKLKWKKREIQTVKFVPASIVFKPEVGFLPTKTISGPVPGGDGTQWEMIAGKKLYIDAWLAREFQVKGYGTVVSGSVEAVSQDERDEILSKVTRIDLGGSNG